MNRNQFLKTLLGGVVCLPVIGTIVAQNKDMEAIKAVSPEDEALLKSLHHNAYESYYNNCMDYIHEYPLTYEECIQHSPPEWAKSYHFVYTDETNLRHS